LCSESRSSGAVLEVFPRGATPLPSPTQTENRTYNEIRLSILVHHLQVRILHLILSLLPRLAAKGLTLSVLCFLVVPALGRDLQLPTPDEHYLEFDVEAESRQLIFSVLARYPQARPLLESFLQPPTAESPESLRSTVELLNTIPWQEWRPELLEQLVHRSRVLDILSPELESWRAFVHDSLLFFLDRLSDERLLERMLRQFQLPATSSRGEQFLSFVSETPTLQKFGQILARNPGLPEDFRRSLQRLENSVSTTSRKELVDLISQEIGAEILARYQIQFASTVLAEASVGAVIEVSLTLPGESRARKAVCKVIKPSAEKGLLEELEIFEQLTVFVMEQGDSYGLGDTPLAQMFAEIKDALSREILVVQEQQNLVSAYKYYSENPRILVPAVYPLSTEKVTFMEFVEGEKITEAFPGDRRLRKILARRLSDVLTYEVLFSKAERAMFHGDPHAGNVFHVTVQGTDPFRIALLDWGLAGSFDRNQRKDLAQLLVGLYLSDGKRLRNHVGVLIEGGLPSSPSARRQIDAIVESSLQSKSTQDSFAVLQILITNLAKEGHKIPFDLALFIKSQLTIAGILSELDPDLRQDDHVMGRLQGQVFKEFPKRLLYTLSIVGWNSHDYPSLLSNEDVRDVEMKRLGIQRALGGVWAVVRYPARILGF